MKAESLRLQLLSIQNGRYVHEACTIANILCNGVPNLEHAYEVVDDLMSERDSAKSHSWTIDEAKEFASHVEKSVRNGIDRAVKFLNRVNSDCK